MKGNSVRNLIKGVCFFVFLSCSSQKDLFTKPCKFDQGEEYEQLFKILYDDINEFEELRKDLKELDVSLGLAGDSDNKYLFILTEYVLEYEKDPNELFLLTEYLRKKYNSTDDLYDEMLRASIRINRYNYCAIYLLAKLRFENGLYEYSFPLINYLYLSKEKPKIEEEFYFFVNEMGLKQKNQVDLLNVISEKVYYID